jgi:hypothetical protein
MTRLPVLSSSIRSIGFDASAGVLEVEFQDGEIYQYCDVPREVHDQLIAAKSVGAFKVPQIKNFGIPASAGVEDCVERAAGVLTYAQNGSSDIR